MPAANLNFRRLAVDLAPLALVPVRDCLMRPRESIGGATALRRLHPDNVLAEPPPGELVTAVEEHPQRPEAPQRPRHERGSLQPPRPPAVPRQRRLAVRPVSRHAIRRYVSTRPKRPCSDT